VSQWDRERGKRSCSQFGGDEVGASLSEDRGERMEKGSCSLVKARSCTPIREWGQKRGGEKQQPAASLVNTRSAGTYPCQQLYQAVTIHASPYLASSLCDEGEDVRIVI